VADGLPVPLLQNDAPLAAGYVDNILVIAATREEAVALQAALRTALTALELVYHEESEIGKVVDFVGYTVDLRLREIRNTSKRAWRLYRALRRLRCLGKCSSAIMEVLVGHIIHFFMLHPEAMAVLARVYDFIKLRRPGLHRFSFQLQTELEVVQGLLFVASIRALHFPVHRVVFCGDSSMQGYSMWAVRTSELDAGSVMAYKEKWRFRQVEDTREDFQPQRQRASTPWQSHGFQTTEMQHASLVLHASGHRARDVIPKRTEEVVGIVPEVPEALMQQAWHPLVKGA